MASPEFLETHHDTIYNYGNTPTIWTTRDGDWSNHRIWSTGGAGFINQKRIPIPGDHVEINHTVNIDPAAATIPYTGALASLVINNTNITQRRGGGLVNHFNSAGVAPTNFSLSANNIYVLEHGLLDFRRDWTILFGGGDYVDADTGKWGNGFIILGQINFRGRSKTNHAVRLAAEISAAATTFTLREPVIGWAVGDKVVVAGGPRTYTPGQEVAGVEVKTITAISSDGITITVSAFANAHEGARGNRNGNTFLRILENRRGTGIPSLPAGAGGSSSPVGPGATGDASAYPWLHTPYSYGDTSTNVIDFLPHVVNLTRSAVIKSYDTSTNAARGHILVVSTGRGSLINVGIENTGRTTCSPLDAVTNHIGRYPLHFHHLEDMEHIEEQFGLSSSAPIFGQQRKIRFNVSGVTVVDNVTTQGVNIIKWPITVHDSRDVLLYRCTCFNWGGAGIVAEGANLPAEETRGNYFIENFVGVTHAAANGRADWGNEGTAYAFWSADNVMFRNIGCHSEFADFEIIGWGYLAKGILMFEQNESYHSPQAMHFWYIVGGVVKDMTGWNLSLSTASQQYPNDGIEYDGLVGRANGSPTAGSLGWSGGDYDQAHGGFRNCDIQGFAYALELPLKMASNSLQPAIVSDYSGGELVVENCYLRGTTADILNRQPHGGGNGQAPSCVPRDTLIRNVRYGPLVSGHAAILMEEITDDASVKAARNSLNLDRLFVQNFNADTFSGSVRGPNFRVFWRMQASSGVMPGHVDPSLPTQSGLTPYFGNPQSGAANSVLASNWLWRMDRNLQNIQFWRVTSGHPEPPLFDPIRQFSGREELSTYERSGTYWKGVSFMGAVVNSGVYDGMLSGWNIDGLIYTY